MPSASAWARSSRRPGCRRSERTAGSSSFSCLGIEPVGGTRQEFVKFTDAERKRLGEIVKAARMQEK